MALHHNPRIVTSGLVLALDAGDVNCFPSKRNFFRNSNEFTVNNIYSGWLALSSATTTRVSNTTTAPDGTMTADSIVAPNGAVLRKSSPILFLKAGVTTTFSIWVKTSVAATFRVDIGDEGNITYNTTTSWQEIKLTNEHAYTYGQGTGYNFVDIRLDAGVTYYFWHAMHHANDPSQPYYGTSDSNTDLYNLVGNTSASLYNGAYTEIDNSGVMGFDGSNDLVGIPYVQDTGGSFTVEVWAKCDSMDLDGANRQVVFSFNTGPEQGYKLLTLGVWSDNANSFNGDGTNYTGGPVGVKTSVDANNWHSYVLSSNSGIWSWYIDGELATSYTPTYTGTSAYFKLATRGSGLSNASSNWGGKIGPAKIYNRALTADEVLQNYNATKTRFGL